MPGKNIGIITTASLPWLTGTSITPLFLARYLQKRGYRTTLYLPWVPPEQQHHCFPDHVFANAREQIDYVAQWPPEDLQPHTPELVPYPARFYASLGSIGPLTDFSDLVGEHDLVLLMEPEHLFASHPWSRFKKKHRRVVGVVMTHYEYYHRQHIPRFMARWYQHYSRFLMKRMCHQLVALAAVQKDVYTLPMCSVVPLNGVERQFFRPPPPDRTRRSYFMGKLIPEKGLEEMFRGLGAVGEREIDLFGNGEEERVRKLAESQGVVPRFKGLSYQPWRDLAAYGIFLNCSRSEYLCTTTANALAMGQWVILPRHPSNEFYYQFANCLAYNSSQEFAEHFNHARSRQPALPDPKLDMLTWDAAADRLEQVIKDRNEPAGPTRRLR